jgi:peptidoglycan-associated lipoprotein
MTTSRTALFSIALAAALAVSVSGCSSKAKQKTTAPQATATEAPAEPSKPEVTPPPVAEPFPQEPLDKSTVGEATIDELNRQGVLRTVYFAYNSDELDDARRAVLQANAQWIAAHPKYTVEIGGHCDERGSIGYNVALGDRRATAVKSYLVGLGASGARLVSVSYGEERPAVPGHDESAWKQNRRGVFILMHPK